MQYYHSDVDSMPARRAALLYRQLPADSRTAAAEMGLQKVPSLLVMALIVDELRNLQYMRAKKKVQRHYITDLVLPKEKKQETEEYADGESFERARARILERIENGG